MSKPRTVNTRIGRFESTHGFTRGNPSNKTVDRLRDTWKPGDFEKVR
jgi:hypothetical protein